MKIFRICILGLYILPSFAGSHGADSLKKYVSQAELEHPLELIPDVIEGVDYIFCIDGGGSKTELQVLDKFGNILPLYYSDSVNPHYVVTKLGSNINVIGEQGVERIFASLFDNLMIGTNKFLFEDVVSNAALVAGMAGLGSDKNKLKMSSILSKYNFKLRRQALFSDASLTLVLAGDEGAILISGTGCICMSKMFDGTTRRAGGYGFPAEDACGGFFYGKRALNYAIQDELGYGSSTSLTFLIRAFFSIDEDLSIIEFFRAGYTGKDIASIAPLVFEQAYGFHDPIAFSIVEVSIEYISRMIMYAIKDAKSLPFKIFLVGGIFKNKYVDEFIKDIEEELVINSIVSAIEWVNLSNEKVFPRIIRQIIGDMLAECKVPD